MTAPLYSHTAFSTEAVQRFKRIQHVLDGLDPGLPPRAACVPGSSMPAGPIIVFPGSFNPPTKAHLALLRAARQYGRRHGVAGVYAALSKHTVDKEQVERPLLLDRIVLLEQILQRYLPQVGIMLFNRGLYVEEAQAIRATYPGVTRLYLLLGFDKIVQVFDQRYYDDRDAALHALFAQAEILVAPREDAGNAALQHLLDDASNRQFAPYVHGVALSSAYRRMSSTHIRDVFEAHQQDVLPDVQRFIEETRVYEPPELLPDGAGEVVQDRYAERIEAILAIMSESA